MFNYCDVISVRAESPEMNAKIVQRRLRKLFLTGCEAQKVHLCSVD